MNQTRKNFLEAMIENFGGYDQAVAWYYGNLNISPVDYRLNLQVLLNALGREEEAFEMSNQLFHLAPDDRRVLFNRGWHLIKRGLFPEGFALLENGRILNTYGHPPLASNQPLWSRQRPHGDSVILVLEGGLGDEIINLRFARELARNHSCKVIVSCSPGLAPLINRMPEVSSVVQREACPGVYHNSWLPAMSAVQALGIELDDLDGSAYLRPQPERIAEWQNRVDSCSNRKLKVGIRWAGNPQFEHQQLRKFPPSLLLDLCEVSGVQLFSFQRDNDLLSLPESIVDLAPQLKDWEDTAAALSQMDLVISSCTSVAHMSAALGKKTWIVVPALPYYPWAVPGTDSPWYDSVQLIRQPCYGDWHSVEQELRQKLFTFVNDSSILKR